MELRRRERVALNESIICDSFKTKKENHFVKTPFQFEIQDLSYGGMKISLDHLLLKHDQITFKLVFGKQSRCFNCEVQWCRVEHSSYVSGIQFIDLSRKDVIFMYAYFKAITKR